MLLFRAVIFIFGLFVFLLSGVHFIADKPSLEGPNKLTFIDMLILYSYESPIVLAVIGIALMFTVVYFAFIKKDVNVEE